DVGHQRRVVFAVDLRLQIGHVAANTGKVLTPVDQQTVGRVLVVVERVVVQRVAERRGQRRAVLQFLADRQRRFAVREAPQAKAAEVGGGWSAEGLGAAGRKSVQLRKGGRRIEGEQAVAGVVVTVGELGRQRDVLLVDRVAQLQRQILAELEAETRAEADGLGAVG